jgi:hypothetical protein
LRDFVRRHPWQLEIVPFAIVVIAFALPLAYRQDMLARMHSWNGYSVEQTWLLRYAFRGMWVLVAWIGNLQSNDIWIRLEREKRFNWWTMSGTAFMSLAGWFMSGWFFGPAWVAIIVLSLALEGLIERSRRFRPREIRGGRIPSVTVKPGEPFYYREERSLVMTPWYVRVPISLCLVPGLWTIAGDAGFPFPLAVGMLIGGLVATRVIFSVSGERVTASIGLMRRVSIPMLCVRGCEVYDYNPLVGRHHGWITTHDGMQLYGARIGPCLRIETTDGKAYLLGVKDPEAICDLIKAAVAAQG